MFMGYDTALFSMYLFLTGDSSALSNWEYKENPSLTFLMITIELHILHKKQRYYHADLDETCRKIRELIKENEWDSEYFPEMKQNLLNKLNIQEKSDKDVLDILLKSLKGISEVQNSYKQIFNENRKS
ncbi:11947_t:CDS:2 [Funneliformis mosseae]|uniref:11947_t:CDS:1 n=1 Tax=Funneliformis mosseae TaxID=27381 RepID=A0A9N9DDW9_FUNMO|nr:11947_t:CDS:2 [Funneliformis mosseae]